MSMQRRCDIFKATDGKWYILLGNFEYAHEEKDCTYYGSFPTYDAAWKELEDHHSNPGGADMDDSGTRLPPKETFKKTWKSW